MPDDTDMTERLMSEGLIGLGAASKLFAQRPNAATVWRWVKSGANGIRLEAVRCGARYYTTKQAVTRFIAAQTDRPSHIPVETGLSAERKASIDRANAILDAAGIK